MNARGTRTLSRLFQATMRMKPEKKPSHTMEGGIIVPWETDGLHESDIVLEEQERIWHYYTKLVFKDGEFLDMNLADKTRRLLCAGKLFCQSDSLFERKGRFELFVLLFDNYLVMAKPVGKRPGTKFHVHKRPIPLDLLKLEKYEDSPTRVKRRSSIFLGKDDAAISYLSEHGALSNADSYRGMFPFTVTYEGHLGGSYTLYADTQETRSMWRLKLEEAIQLRQQSSRVFKMKVLNRESFLVRTGVSNGYLPEGREFTRTINSITPFTTRDGRSLMAIGCVEGLWIGSIQGDSQSFHRILPLQMIRQCAVLEEFGIILILAHNDLCAYDLESCVPTSADPKACDPPQKLNGKNEVSFFRVGMIDGKAHIIFAVKKRADTIFRILEVVRTVEQESTVNSPDVKAKWFRIYRDFLLPSTCSDVIFLRRSLVVLHRNSASLVSVLDLQRADIPVPAERNMEHRSLVKRCTSSKSIGIFRLQTETFVLCYDKFGVYVDRQGTLINDRVAVEWEGAAQSVSYHHPYILLFSSSFVEVRHAASGQLEQIIRGDGIRCIWEGGGHQGEDPATVRPSRNFGVIGVSNEPAGLDELAVQCIFTLAPSKSSLSHTQSLPSMLTAQRPNTRL